MRVMCESSNPREQYSSRKQKDEKREHSKSGTKNVVANNRKWNNLLKLEAGEGKQLCNDHRVGFLKGNTKHENEINKKKCPNNNNTNNKNKNIMKRISSKIIFRRKFARYNEVRQKLNDKWKSMCTNSREFDHCSTKCKSYANKKQSLAKYSTCGFGFNKEITNKKCPTVRPSFPGKGTYNHRFAYDKALQLHRKGVDADVLYKVKNKTDSIYAINGKFLLKNDKRWAAGSTLNKASLKGQSKKKTLKTKKLVDSQEITSGYDTLGLKKSSKNEKNKKKSNNRIEEITTIQKGKMERKKKKENEEFVRNQNTREIKKSVLSQLSQTIIGKLFKKNAKHNERKNKNDNSTGESASKKRREGEDNEKREKFIREQNARKTDKNFKMSAEESNEKYDANKKQRVEERSWTKRVEDKQKQMDIDLVESQTLDRLKYQQFPTSKYENNINNHKNSVFERNSVNRYNGHKVRIYMCVCIIAAIKL